MLYRKKAAGIQGIRSWDTSAQTWWSLGKLGKESLCSAVNAIGQILYCIPYQTRSYSVHALQYRISGWPPISARYRRSTAGNRIENPAGEMSGYQKMHSLSKCSRWSRAMDAWCGCQLLGLGLGPMICNEWKGSTLQHGERFRECQHAHLRSTIIKKGTKLHLKLPTAERRQVLCVGIGGDLTHAARPGGAGYAGTMPSFCQLG